MNQQYGKRNKPSKWLADGILLRYALDTAPVSAEDAAWEAEMERLADAATRLWDAPDSGIHPRDWRSEVSERGENIRVYVGERGYW